MISMSRTDDYSNQRQFQCTYEHVEFFCMSKSGLLHDCSPQNCRADLTVWVSAAEAQSQVFYCVLHFLSSQALWDIRKLYRRAAMKRRNSAAHLCLYSVTCYTHTPLGLDKEKHYMMWPIFTYIRRSERLGGWNSRSNRWSMRRRYRGHLQPYVWAISIYLFIHPSIHPSIWLKSNWNHILDKENKLLL